MAVIESPEVIGVKPFHEFDDANATWPRGDRLEAIRAAADDFRRRFKDQGQISAVRTVDLVSAGYPTRYAFGGAAKGVNPYINITNRLVVVQFHDFEGARRVRPLAGRRRLRLIRPPARAGHADPDGHHAGGAWRDGAA